MIAAKGSNTYLMDINQGFYYKTALKVLKKIFKLINFSKFK